MAKGQEVREGSTAKVELAQDAIRHSTRWLLHQADIQFDKSISIFARPFCKHPAPVSSFFVQRVIMCKASLDLFRFS